VTLMRLLLSALPADTAAQDATALVAAASELGPLVALIVGACAVMLALIRYGFGWLTKREERMAASPSARSSTPPVGVPSVNVLHADLRALEERLRAMEAREAGAASMMSGLRDEMRTGMRDLKEQQAVFSKALTELTRSVDRLVGASLVDK